MAVLAKMYVEEIVASAWRGSKEKTQERVKLDVVYGDEGENADFAKATPTGSLELVVDNPDAWGFFKAGEEYYVEIRKARS